MFGRDKALLRGVLAGGVWNGFLLVKVKGQHVLMVIVIFSGTVLFLLWLRSVNILSFMVLWRWISLIGLGVFCGVGGYL